MAIANMLKLEAARTTFDALAAEAFGSDRTNRYGVFTRTAPCAGEYFEIDAMGATPAVQEILGSRRWGNLRAYVNRVRVKRWGPDGIELPIIKINNDPNGLIEMQLRTYMEQVSNFYEKPVTDFLLSNPTCLDGGALLSDTHSFGAAGGTWDNLGAALTPAAWFTGISTMEALQLENGEPAGVYPNVVMVAPSLRKMALDLVSQDRVVPVGTAGVEVYSAALAVAARSNFIQETPIKVIVNPRFVGSGFTASWFLLDDRLEARRPIVVGEAIAPTAQLIIDPASPAMIDRSAAQAYIEAQAALAGSVPLAVYGYIA